MIRNVVFDMGNVILDFSAKRYLDTWVEAEADKALLMRELFDSIEWVMTDHGTLDNKGLCSAVCARVPQRLHAAVGNIIAHWWEDMPVLPGMEELIRGLLEEGYRLYVLSNVGEYHSLLQPKIPHIERFSGVFFSSQWKMLKPEVEIYRTFCAHFGLVPDECLFIDDRKDNAYGAQRIGMHGLAYHGQPEEIKEALNALR